ncbi:hypothetical protein [Mucilaginibacter sp.]|uniref:hypothetical protein n=1 Tax=Mucilaginibacter sp. TaxID=1882438 RepID=UPI0035BBFE6E
MSKSPVKIPDLKNRPFVLFALLALVLLIASLFPSSKNVDLNLSDTYFVVAITGILRTLAWAMLLLFLIYFFANRLLLSTRITWAHILLTIMPLIVLLILFRFFRMKRHLPDIMPWHSPKAV